MDSQSIKNKEQVYMAKTYKRNPVVIESGLGSYAKDPEGNTYLDFTSGIGVNSLGFSFEPWVKAVQEQCKKLSHISNIYYSAPQTQLAETLCKRAQMKRVFFSNSGAEANEAGIKSIRKYKKEKFEIITLKQSFHGRTITTLSATGQNLMHQHFEPFTQGFVFVEPNDITALKTALTPQTAGIIIECIQGEGGVNTLEKQYVKQIQAICKAQDILLMVDEVQTGVGRSGTFLALEQYGIQADIISLAKGLGGGLPIGATLFNEKAQNILGLSDHGSTFGGNPIVCSGAQVVLDTIDEAFLKTVRDKSAFLKQELKSLPKIQSISGEGLLLGIELKGDQTVAEIQAKCLKAGLLILTAKNKIRLMPPLNISMEDIKKGIQILKENIGEKK